MAQAFITETKNLFIVCTSADHYLIFQVSLDDGFESGNLVKERAFRAEFVWKYPKSAANGSDLLGMHVRDSSEKDNQKLMIFLLHEGCLYCYTKGADAKLEKMFPTLQRNMFKINDNAFAIR